MILLLLCHTIPVWRFEKSIARCRPNVDNHRSIGNRTKIRFVHKYWRLPIGHRWIGEQLLYSISKWVSFPLAIQNVQNRFQINSFKISCIFLALWLNSLTMYLSHFSWVWFEKSGRRAVRVVPPWRQEYSSVCQLFWILDQRHRWLLHEGVWQAAYVGVCQIRSISILAGQGYVDPWKCGQRWVLRWSHASRYSDGQLLFIFKTISGQKQER